MCWYVYYIIFLICFLADVIVGFICLNGTMTQTASILELARLCVDSGWIPPRPVIFLFNGAEELFMLVRRSLRGTNNNLVDPVLFWYFLIKWLEFGFSYVCRLILGFYMFSDLLLRIMDLKNHVLCLCTEVLGSRCHFPTASHSPSALSYKIIWFSSISAFLKFVVSYLCPLCSLV